MKPIFLRFLPKTSSGDDRKARRFEFTIALALTLFLVVLHLLLLGNRGPLWRDEISSLSAASQPSWNLFWQALSLDPCPPLFFLMLRGWSELAGKSDLALRLLGCLIGLASLAAVWANARLTHRKPPTLALLLLGALPTCLIWGDSLRAYGLGTLWAILSYAFYWRVLVEPTRRNLAGALVVSLLAVHSLYIDSFIVFACASSAALLALQRHQWRRAILILGIGAITALSLVSYAPLFRATNEWASLLRIDFSFRESLRILEWSLLGRRFAPFWTWIVLLLAAVIVVVGRRRNSETMGEGAREVDLGRYALIATLIAFTATMLFFRVVGWGTNVWYYLPTLTIAALGIDSILHSERFKNAVPFVRGATAIIALCMSLPLLLRASEIRASNVDEVAAIVAKHADAKDLVILWPMTDGITFKRYADGGVPWTSLPPLNNFPAQPGDDVLLPFREPHVVKGLFERIETTLREGGRVWLSTTWDLELPPGPLRPVLPLDKNHPRSMGYFLRGWGYLLAAQLRTHAAEAKQVQLAQDQPISVYEHAQLMVFSGWK